MVHTFIINVTHISNAYYVTAVDYFAAAAYFAGISDFSGFSFVTYATALYDVGINESVNYVSDFFFSAYFLCCS